MKLSTILALLTLLLIVLLSVPAAAKDAKAPAPEPTASAAVPAAAPASPSTPKAEAEARLARGEALYREATKLFRERKLEPAVAKYREALELKQTYDIAGNLGTAELALKRYADAAEHLALCLRIFPVNASAEERGVMQRHLATARAEIGTLTIVAPLGAEVVSGGRSVGTAPIEYDIYVEPGKHTIEARLEEHVTTTVDIDIAAGQALDVELPQGAALAADPVAPDERSYVPEIVLGSIAAVGFITGGALYGVASSADGSARDQLAELPPGATGMPCDLQSNASVCAGIADDIDSAYSLSGAGIGMLAVGGAALAAGVVHFAVVGTGDEPASDARLFHISPMLGSANGIHIGGTF